MYNFLSLLIGLLSLAVLPHVSFVHAGEDQGPTDSPMPTLVPCEKNGYTCRYQVCQKNEWENYYSCGSSLLVCCQPIPTTSTPTPTRTTTPSVPPECPYIPATLWCFDSYSPPQLWWCENQRKTTYHSTCGYRCNADKTACNESAYCENWCDTDNCPAPQMRIYCWTDRTKQVEIPTYFDETPPIVAVCCNNLTYCNGTNCGARPPPTPFCHPVTNVCHADTLVPPCKDQYPSAPYEWWDNCGGISCLADPCTAPTTAPGDPICVPDCSCAANTCIGQTCTEPNCNGICNGSRDCSVTLTATAKYFATVPANCSDITNPAQGNYLYPVTFTMNGSPSTLTSKQLVSPNINVSWTNVQTGTYNIVSAPPPSPEYQYVTTCWTKSNGNSGQASSITFDPITEIGVTGNFFVAFGPPGPWHQTQEGDVYSGGTLQTFVPSTAANRYYTLAGAGGTRGVITADTLTVLPTPAWRISGHSNPTQNYYASYLRKAATTTKTPLNPGTVSSFPASSTVYTTTGDLTFGNGSTLTVPDGVSVVYLVDGNVTITQPLTLANPNTSFLAIIASGTISVASTITGSSANPGLDGVFLASTFRDLESVSPPASPHTPLYVRGLVGANTVNLLRDNAVRSVPAETFLYNPALPFSMPEWMKDLYYEWREVAP